MSLYIRLHNIISPNNFSLYYKSGESVGNPNSGFTYYNSYTGGTTGVVISNVPFSFNTKYWIKIVDDVTKKYIIENIYTHESCFYDCFDATQTPTPTKTPTQTPTIPITQTQTPTQTPTKATVNSCIDISYVLKQVDNLGCGIFDRYYEYTLTYEENGIVKPAPEDITFTVTTDRDGSTTYPILLPQGSSTVTDDSVLIREWDNCENKISYDYSVISTGITPTYSLCSIVAVTQTPTPTPTGVGTCNKITDLVVSGTEILGEGYLRIQINLENNIDISTEFEIQINLTNYGQITQTIRVNQNTKYSSILLPMGYSFIPIIDSYCVNAIMGSSKINCGNFKCTGISCPCVST
jgi:hypothetical protein